MAFMLLVCRRFEAISVFTAVSIKQKTKVTRSELEPFLRHVTSLFFRQKPKILTASTVTRQEAWEKPGFLSILFLYYFSPRLTATVDGEQFLSKPHV